MYLSLEYPVICQDIPRLHKVCKMHLVNINIWLKKIINDQTRNRIKYWFCNLVCTNSQELTYLKRVWTQSSSKIYLFLFFFKSKKVNLGFKTVLAQHLLFKVSKCINLLIFHSKLTPGSSSHVCVFWQSQCTQESGYCQWQLRSKRCNIARVK